MYHFLSFYVRDLKTGILQKSMEHKHNKTTATNKDKLLFLIKIIIIIYCIVFRWKFALLQIAEKNATGRSVSREFKIYMKIMIIYMIVASCIYFNDSFWLSTEITKKINLNPLRLPNTKYNLQPQRICYWQVFFCFF